MTAQTSPRTLHPDERRTLDALAQPLLRTFGIVGLVGLALAVGLALSVPSASQRYFHSYLVSYTYFVSLSLGALCFVLLQHLVRAGWSVVVRRIAEAAAANVLLLAILVIPVLVGMRQLYPWADTARVAADPLLQHKQPYLNLGFLLVRLVLYFGIWIGLSQYLWQRSIAQDRSGDPALTLHMERISAPGTILYALALTFFSFDLMMSLDPYWFSTIYGVYYFAGAMLGFVAFLIVALLYLQSRGRLTHAVTVEHYHDLGKLLFAFTIFWAYIAFSQYMLYWYANMPEETAWYLRRQVGRDLGSWTVVGVLLVLGHFAVPFLGLLQRAPKRNPPVLAGFAVWVLVVHWFDLYWLILPEQNAASARLALVDLFNFVGLGGLYLAGLVYWLRAQTLIPVGDPRLGDSLVFENA